MSLFSYPSTNHPVAQCPQGQWYYMAEGPLTLSTSVKEIYQDMLEILNIYDN
jgi:hypothetical protein